jgi:hypothetical protein
MSESSLSFSSSSTFRNQLIARNLQPYKVPGVFSPGGGAVNYETNLTVTSVVDSPDTLISTNNLANSLYSLNEYGPDGGFQGKYSLPGAPYPVESNKGPYGPNDTQMDLINEFFIDAAYIQNVYGPEGGYNNLVIITDVVGNPKLYQPYWDPSSFVSSSYSTYDLVFNENPTGSNGPLSQDTYLARIGASTLKGLFEERIAAQITKNTIGRINLDSLTDPTTAALVASGKEPFVEKNWTISEPENPLGAAVSFANRLTGTYFPSSLIPGNYFNDVNIQAPKLEKALNVINPLTGGLLGPILDNFRNPSETFVANTGNGQRSILFSSLDYNKYRPKYTRGPIQSITTGLDRILDPNKPNTGGYYVGSPEAEPSKIDSPANQMPVGPGGRQISTIVYGPQELGILYEGNQNKIQNGLAGKALTDGGGIAGQFVWTSPKYKPNAGFKVGVGGKVTSVDEEYNVIKTDYEKYQSTDTNFREGSILDDTQRLINSADNVQGGTRLKHVGNAINQVSKVFNDGYKEITKGSQVLSYKDNSDGSEAGIEYCRIFTKDTPYYTYGDLQKSDGITNSGRKFSYSIIDNTYNLNIAPLKNPGSTNIIDNKVKKYMFSIENLAWRTSDRPGYTYDDLPVCERGPNGGRIMWFPPYGLTFSDDSKPSFNSTTFLGRPEPIYTYKNTTRSGSIGFKMVVDHPSVMNTIVQKQLKKIPKEQVDSMLNSFFAGCLKYDLYELGIKFNTIPTRDLFTYQQVLNNPRLTSEELGKVAFEIPQSPENKNQNTGGGNNANNTDVAISSESKTKNETSTQLVDAPELNKFIGYGWYFDNNAPNSTTGASTYGKTATNDFQFWYDSYVGTDGNGGRQVVEYVNSAPDKVYLTDDKTEGPKGGVITYNGSVTTYERSAIPTFFTQIVKGNFEVLKGGFLDGVKKILKEGGEITLGLTGSASATASVGYNVDISERRNDSVNQWLEKQEVEPGKTIGDYVKSGKFKLKFTPKGEETVILKTNADANASPDQTDITLVDSLGKDSFLSSSVDCGVNVRELVGPNQYKRTSFAEWYSIPPMACRRVAITSIVAKKLPDPPDEVIVEDKKVEDKKGTGGNENVKINPSDAIKPSPNITVEQKIKDGISKKVLRHLFSECDYFEVLKESDPMIFQSIKDKIKYFTPAFHSTTPEGLNGRLTFLNQCVRPGQTIPIIGADGRPKYNDALNTSFGAPPILVLRIGDFYHSKIVPNSLTFKYDDAKYDINPEGIGMQPMIVDVNLSFDFIGGHGLKGPVEELQNALSFNFYANTEIYDERATATEDVSARDKYVVEKILANQPPVKVNEVKNPVPKKGGSTIGTIVNNTDIDYTKSINSFWAKTVEYFDSFINTHETIVKNNNIGLIYMLFLEKDYLSGNFDEFGQKQEVFIYGKSRGTETKLDRLFRKTLEDVSDKSDPFMKTVIDKYKTQLNNRDKREISDKLISFINSKKSEFSLNINNDLKGLVSIQEEYVQFFRQFNLLLTKTDGSLNTDNVSNTYNLSGITSGSIDSFVALKDAYTAIKNKHNEFFVEENGIVKSSEILGLDLKDNIYNKADATFFDQGWKDRPDDKERNIRTFAFQPGNDDQSNRFYQVMAQTFSDQTKLTDFKNYILNSTIYSDKSVAEKAVNDASEYCTNLFNFYTEKTKERFSVTKIKENEKYKNLIKNPINETTSYKLNYVLTTAGTDQQKTRITELYSTNNVNANPKTFDGKIKFN